jgi:hypothetical protein
MFRRSSAAIATSREGHRSLRSGRASQHRLRDRERGRDLPTASSKIAAPTSPCGELGKLAPSWLKVKTSVMLNGCPGATPANVGKVVKLVRDCCRADQRPATHREIVAEQFAEMGAPCRCRVALKSQLETRLSIDVIPPTMVVVILARVRHELYRRHPAQGGACHWRKNRSTIKELRTARRGLLRPACLNPTDGIGRGECDPAKFGSGTLESGYSAVLCGLT